jgi:hypothetical protein
MAATGCRWRRQNSAVNENGAQSAKSYGSLAVSRNERKPRNLLPAYRKLAGKYAWLKRHHEKK